LRELRLDFRGIAVARRPHMVALAQGDEAATTVDRDGDRERENTTRPYERARRASAPLGAGDRYELGDPIGRGGMGEVIEAYDKQIGREVAIKRLRTDEPTPHQLSRFLREARIQGRLEHPAIPPVHELSADAEGRPFFAMKKLAGVTLAEVLRDPDLHGEFTRQRQLRAFVDVCRAVELAHRRGIVHRDLKPANVLLGDHGEVYVLDWGIARELDVPERSGQDAGPLGSMTRGRPTGDVAGTPAYMAPEQARGDPDIDGRADVYSLGCTLYEILTGAQLHPHRPPTRPPCDDVPPELEHACAHATARDRKLRTRSARELGDDVQRYLDGDRDLEHRRELATHHLARAHGALESAGLDEVRRRTAMREAGRALALDPTLKGAADLVSRLMLEPPSEVPRAVAEELEALDLEEDRRHIRLVTRISVAYIAYVPLLLLFGIRDAFYLTAFALLAFANLGGQLAAIRNERFMKASWPIALASALAQIVLMARMWTPFLVAPSLVAVGVMSFGMSAQAARRGVLLGIAGLATLALLVTFGAEAVGLVSRTTWTDHGLLVMRSPLEGIDHFPILAAMCLYVVSLIASAGLLAAALSRMRRKSRLQQQTQSWQLRQLLH
jgi:serine/threonine-protein kinase